jgi:hypothetical protein
MARKKPANGMTGSSPSGWRPEGNRWNHPRRSSNYAKAVTAQLRAAAHIADVKNGTTVEEVIVA